MLKRMTQPTQQEIFLALGSVVDPELGYSITALGLVYDIAHAADDALVITMTLTSPACPRPDFFREGVIAAIHKVAPNTAVEVRFTFTPPWTLQQATEETRAELAAKGIPLTRW